MVPTFYGLDALNNEEEVNLTSTSITDFKNESTTNADDAVLQMVKSPIYSQYKQGIPQKLRSFNPRTFRTLPAAFYEIPGANATPKRLEKNSDIEVANSSGLSYVYRIGSNGPSIQYIKEGKIKDIKNFIKDYKNITLNEQMQSAQYSKINEEEVKNVGDALQESSPEQLSDNSLAPTNRIKESPKSPLPVGVEELSSLNKPKIKVGEYDYDESEDLTKGNRVAAGFVNPNLLSSNYERNFDDVPSYDEISDKIYSLPGQEVPISNLKGGKTKKRRKQKKSRTYKR